jgi:hypothetical protein
MNFEAHTQMAYAAANLQSASATMDTQRVSYDASTEKLMENLVKISDIQQTISSLTAENVTLVCSHNLLARTLFLILTSSCRRPRL